MKSLGPGKPLPVEVTPFSAHHTRRTLENVPELAGCAHVLAVLLPWRHGPDPFPSPPPPIATHRHPLPPARCRALIRRGNVNTSVSDGFEPAITDNGNYVVRPI